jgi:hypothetical protein
MIRCDEFEPLIERMLAEDIDHRDRDRLLPHAQSCGSCRQYVELHHRLLGSELAVELPTDEEFGAMRRAVVAQIGSAEERPARSVWAAVGEFFQLMTMRPAYAGALAALLVVMLGAGIGLGHWWGQGSASPELIGMLPVIDEQAMLSSQVRDLEDSPYLYSNVTFDDLGGGRLALSFDVTRHMQLSRPKSDPLVKEILVQSLINPGPIETRMSAVGYAEQMIDGKVKQALIVSMLNDPNQAVRMRALEILSSHTEDPEVQSAMLVVMRGEESVQMRLEALDQLAKSSFSRERFGQAVEDLSWQDDRALLVRAASYTP